MVDAGLMSEAEAYADARAHAITGWLGADAVELDPHVAAFEPDGPGVVVVCTDGLWNYAESAADLAEAIPADAAARPLAGARALLGVALDGGGHDNVTVAVLPFPAAVSRAGFATRASSRRERPGGRRSRAGGLSEGVKEYRKRWPTSPSRTCRSSPSTCTRTSTCPRAAARSTRSSR